MEFLGAAPVPPSKPDTRITWAPALCNTGCYGSHTCFRYQLDGDSCSGVGVLQVVDQLCQILDGVDIVMRRREIRPTPVVE